MAQQDDLGAMLALYRAVWRATGRQQVFLIVLSLVVAALAAGR